MAYVGEELVMKVQKLWRNMWHDDATQSLDISDEFQTIIAWGEGVKKLRSLVGETVHVLS